MAILPKNVSILIPAFGRPEMTFNAVQCAIQTNAGEIIISDDASGMDLFNLLKKFSGDKRLRIFHQKNNLGLWPHHLFLVNQASGNWIKFLQTDDSFSPEDLDNFCQWAEEDVALISMEPKYLYSDGRVEEVGRIKEPIVFEAKKFSGAMMMKGNVAGRPSYCLYQKELMKLDVSFWENEISADLVQNWYLGTRGKVILLPAGRVYCGVHGGQEGKKQTYHLIFSRLTNSLRVVGDNAEDEESKMFVSVYGLVEYAGLFAAFFLAMVRKGEFHLELLLKTWIKSFFLFIKCFSFPAYWKPCFYYFKFKFMDKSL